MSMQPSRSQPARVSARSRVHAALPRSRPSFGAMVSLMTIACGGVVADYGMPTHPDSPAPPPDPYNPAATQLLDDTQWQLASWANADGKTRPVPANSGATSGAGGEPLTLNFSTE